MRGWTEGNVLWREAMAVARQGLLLPRKPPVLDRVPPGDSLTVFIHGYMSWGGALAPLADHLAARGLARRQLHLSYLPIGSIAELALRLEASIRRAGPTGEVHVVAHSLGGLVARYYCQILGGRIDRLICLATPHAGTTRARPWTALPLAGEIAPHSPILSWLDRTRDRLANSRVCSLLAEGDVVVSPLESAALEGHEIVRLAGVGHHSILFDSEAWQHVERILAEPSAGRGRTHSAPGWHQALTGAIG